MPRRKMKSATIKHYTFFDKTPDYPAFHLYVSGKHTVNYQTEKEAVEEAVRRGCTGIWIHDIREVHLPPQLPIICGACNQRPATTFGVITRNDETVNLCPDCLDEDADGETLILHKP